VARERFPASVLRLLWDVDHESIDADRDRRLILERVMTRGTWDAMCWLRQRYSAGEIAEFLRSDAARNLSPRDVAYWSLIAGVDVPSVAGGARPKWAGR